MTRKQRPPDDREPCPPVAVTPEVVIRAAGAPTPTLKATDGYDAPPKRERKAATGEIETTVIRMEDKPPVTRPMPDDPYRLDDESTIDREDT